MWPAGSTSETSWEAQGSNERRTLALEDERSDEHVLLRAVDGGQLAVRVETRLPRRLPRAPQRAERVALPQLRMQHVAGALRAAQLVAYSNAKENINKIATASNIQAISGQYERYQEVWGSEWSTLDLSSFW